jgi:transaldolase
MKTGYFHEVYSKFGTEFWVNNPSGPEMKNSLAAGAVGVASNPKYIATMLNTDIDFVHKTIDDVLEQTTEEDPEQLAIQVLRKAVSRPLKLFHSLYQKSKGRYGHVAIQGNPRRINDPEAMLEEAVKFRDLGENIIIKQPSTIEGAKVMEELTARGWSTIGTLSSSVSQYIYMAEAHRRGLQRTNKKPKCLITMLPGLFDEYLAEDAARRGIKVSSEVMYYAGISTTRAAYKIYRERNYEAIVLSGGARSPFHWTELVGQGMSMTLSGKLADTLVQEHPQVVSSIEESAPAEVLKELRQKFPDFIRACEVDGLAPEEFLKFGPVTRFHNILLDGFSVLIKEIQSRREKTKVM